MRSLVRVSLVGCLVAIAATVLMDSAPTAAQSPVMTSAPEHLRGGPQGVVKTTGGLPVEGMMVQLVSDQNSVRTTVYTSASGSYEFPRMGTGSYTLRLARPLEYKTYWKEGVQIDGATALPDIIAERVSTSEFIPPHPDILPQLSGSEWVANLPGSAQEKKSFVNSCGGSCHSFQMQMRARFDEANWRKLVLRMSDYGGRTLVGRPDSGAAPTAPFASPSLAGMRLEEGEMERVVQWLVKVRGLDSKDPSFKPFPRPTGVATRAVVTEYELPQELSNIHDVAGDQEGNIWYTINRSPLIGKLEPKTGKVVSYQVPTVEGEHPGNHWIHVDEEGIVWFTPVWAGGLARLDPRTGDMKVAYGGPSHSTTQHPDGTLWRLTDGAINVWDPSQPEFWQDPEPVESFNVPNGSRTYGTAISWDGKYWGGGGNDGIVWLNIETGEVREVPIPSGLSAHGRGNFDPDGNLWVGSKQGVLIKYDYRTNLIQEYPTPSPYTSFYSVRADKNGHIWSGEMHAGRVARFNPQTEQFVEYVLPTPWSQDYNSWIDNSTSPVSYWYGDQYGYIVHVQPFE
jgi:streptogramin lyase